MTNKNKKDVIYCSVANSDLMYKNTKDGKMLNIDYFYGDNRSNYIGAFIIEQQTGIWQHVFWTMDKKLIEDIKALDLINVYIHSDEHDSVYFISMIYNY